jgi:ferredoxin
MLSEFKILLHQGKQYIPDVTSVEVPGIYRGRPVISAGEADAEKLAGLCPTGAIATSPVRIDLGKCVFCGECERVFPSAIRFTKDYKISSNLREGLIVYDGQDEPVKVYPEKIRKEIRDYLQVLNGRYRPVVTTVASGIECRGNVNFDIGRFGSSLLLHPACRHYVAGPIAKIWRPCRYAMMLLQPK